MSESSAVEVKACACVCARLRRELVRPNRHQGEGVREAAQGAAGVRVGVKTGEVKKGEDRRLPEARL